VFRNAVLLLLLGAILLGAVGEREKLWCDLPVINIFKLSRHFLSFYRIFPSTFHMHVPFSFNFFIFGSFIAYLILKYIYFPAFFGLFFLYFSFLSVSSS
jgi:hypothetical protein